MGEFERPKLKFLKCGFVKLFNPAIKNDIFIPERHINNAKPGEIVMVRITKWE
jgi:exoribonuclease R